MGESHGTSNWGERFDLSHHWSFKPPPPPIEDLGYITWQQRDHCVFNWIINNLETNLVNEVSRYATARDLWDGLAVTYGSGSDPLQIWDLHQQANEMKQGGMALEELWNKFQDLWILIDTRDPNPMSYPSEIEKYNLRERRHRLYQFLRALDSRFDGIKKEIINKDPLPSVRQAYGMVRREAINLGVLKPESKGLPNNGIGSGLAAMNRPPPPPSHSPYTANRRTGEDDKSKLTCSHCGGKKHTKEGCFLLIGFPEWWDEMKRVRAARGGREQSGNHGRRAAVATAGGGWTNDDLATIAGHPAGSADVAVPPPPQMPSGNQGKEGPIEVGGGWRLGL